MDFTTEFLQYQRKSIFEGPQGVLGSMETNELLSNKTKSKYK